MHRHVCIGICIGICIRMCIGMCIGSGMSTDTCLSRSTRTQPRSSCVVTKSEAEARCGSSDCEPSSSTETIHDVAVHGPHANTDGSDNVVLACRYASVQCPAKWCHAVPRHALRRGACGYGAVHGRQRPVDCRGTRPARRARSSHRSASRARCVDAPTLAPAAAQHLLWRH